jgi:hypothetical protein
MGIEDMVNKAKDALGGSGATDDAIDQVAETVKEKTPDQIDPAVDQAAQAVKDQI